MYSLANEKPLTNIPINNITFKHTTKYTRSLRKHDSKGLNKLYQECI